MEVNLSQDLSACGGVLLKSDKCAVIDNHAVRPSLSKEKIVKTVKIWIQRSRQRKQLVRLDKHLLDDIGLTEEQVKNEISKPFWK
jgi:uncharacterized protein YjiS (DUF1127 family)